MFKNGKVSIFFKKTYDCMFEPRIGQAGLNKENLAEYCSFLLMKFVIQTPVLSFALLVNIRRSFEQQKDQFAIFLKTFQFSKIFKFLIYLVNLTVLNSVDLESNFCLNIGGSFEQQKVQFAIFLKTFQFSKFLKTLNFQNFQTFSNF